MVTSQIDADLRREFEAVASASGCELLDYEFRAGILRLTIDKSPGVTLDECQSVSKQISALLDVADFGSSRYVLEVSSPGLDRKFYSESDYERFLDRRVRVTWRPEGQPTKRTDVGRLTAFDTEQKRIGLSIDATGENLTIPLQSIEISRLEPEL